MRSSRSSLAWGVIFIVLGTGFLLERLGVIVMSGRFVGATLLIGLGLALILGHRDDDKRRRPPEPYDPPKTNTPA